MKLVGKITWDDVRSACCKHDWYTCGDSAAYIRLSENVFDHRDINLAEGNNAWYVLTAFAEDIKRHSDTEWDVENITHVLLNKVRWYFDEEN